MQHVPDPYRLLGVSPGASDAQIKSAHRALAKRYHPDSPSGDTVRFLQVQEAYDLLSDPLRRREWDARHLSGPMRATQAQPPRPRAADGRWTRAADASGPRADTRGTGAARPERPTASPREPGGRSYTWSAGDVPWWEDHGPRESRRQPGRQRPREAQRPEGPQGPQGPPPDRPAAAPDFDVYNRSSGAAWSSAARAYFRSADKDLPRRGSFQRQGTQPLTAARARAAAEEAARQAASEANAEPTPRPSGSRKGRPSPSPGPPPHSPSPPPRPGQRAQRPTEASRASRPAGPAQPAYAWAGVARDAQSISSARSSAREAARASRWPSLSERLAFALLAWLPIAVLIGYAGSVVTGCDRAAVSCPPNMEAVQSALIALALVLFVALPRIAYVAAFGAAGLLIGAMAIVLGAWFAGVRPPLQSPGMAVLAVVLAIAYLATASWALADGPRRRPWLAGTRRRWERSW